MVLEFKKGVSLDIIKAEMESYRDMGFNTMCVINGEKVYSNDPEFYAIFERLKLGLPKEEYAKYYQTKNEISKLENCISKASSIENYSYYRYYFGLATRYVKTEKKTEFFDFVLNNFSAYSGPFVLATQLMMILNYSDLDIHREINNVLNSYRACCNNNFSEYGLDVDRALWLVKEYGKKGYLVDTLFFSGITHEYVEDAQDRIEVLERKLK